MLFSNDITPLPSDEILAKMMKYKNEDAESLSRESFNKIFDSYNYVFDSDGKITN